MPYYREKLLSAWPNHDLYDIGYPAEKVPPEIFKTMIPASNGYRAPNPQKRPRNQVYRVELTESDSKAILAPKFLSEKARNSESRSSEDKYVNDVIEVFNATGLTSNLKAEVPIMYRNVEIKYSKFGVDDFDFQ